MTHHRLETNRELILNYLSSHPWSTATQVAKNINRNLGGVSSMMCKMRNAQVLATTRFHSGPRGGITYALWGTNVTRTKGNTDGIPT